MSDGRDRKGDGGSLLQHFASLQKSGFALLDGGFATHIEDALGQDISSSPLWSASLLDSEQGSKAIIKTHLDFLLAGADVVSTSSYQASALAFRLAGMPAEKAEELLVKSVRLAQQAREDYSRLNTRKECHNCLLLLSLGPYGAALSNGSEYTGDYFVPDASKDNKSGEAVTVQDLEEFHFARLQTIASNAVWSHVDLIAFETIPRLDEAVAIRRALNRLFSIFSIKVSYASFVFPNGNCLPWPAPVVAGGNEDMEKLLQKTLGIDEQGRSSPLTGVGINCTKPKYLTRLVQGMTTALAHVETSTKPYLFLYPDGGLVWDGIKRVWTEEKGSHSSSLSWSDQVMEAGKASRLDNTLWAGCFVGGCCKATACDISALRTCLNADGI